MRTGALVLGILGRIGGFIAISAGCLFGGPLLIIGGLLALAGRKSTKEG